MTNLRARRNAWLGGAIVTLMLAPPVRAADVGDFGADAAAIVTAPLSEIDTLVRAKCEQVAYYASHAEDLKTCSHVDAKKLTGPGQAFVATANLYLWLTDRPQVGACQPTAPTFPAGADVGALKAAELAKLRPRMRAAIDAVDRAVLVADGNQRGPRDFEAIAAEAIAAGNDEAQPTRADACLDAYRKRLDALGNAQLEQALDSVTQEAHETDTLRKTSPGSTIATLASAAVEQPGSPDYVVYSLMSALGADQETSGTQLSVSLSLSSLIWPEPEVRLKQNVGLRNVFLRGSFPLDVTKEQTRAPAEAAANEGAVALAETDSVRRFSLLAGGSVWDETDTRHDANRRCYEAALAYAGFASTAKADESRMVERQTYFDICNRLVVNRMRLSWRAGVGFLSKQADTRVSTKPELGAAIVVWAPMSQLYFNVLGQYFVEPRKILVGGLGFSLAGNVGGGTSGTRSWARLGLDVTGLLARELDAETTSWEIRLAPAVRSRMLSDTVTSFEIGPRFKRDGKPELLATVTFGYDADRIVRQLLTPVPGAH